MQERSLKYIACARCRNNRIELEEYSRKEQQYIIEGKIICKKCQSMFPIIEGIPVLWPSIDEYLYTRPRLGGELMLKVSSPQLKNMIKASLSKIPSDTHDNSGIEKKWVGIYKRSKRSWFYSHVKKILYDLGVGDTAVDYGCSIGIISNHISKFYSRVFGLDQSFYAIRHAKVRSYENTEYMIAHPLNPPFVDKKFDLVVGLNVLDLIEPVDFLNLLCRQAKRHLLISDPYDYDRGTASVKTPVYETEVRKKIKEAGFTFLKKTGPPKSLPWKINVNERLSLYYKVDLIVVKRRTPSQVKKKRIH